MISTFCFTRHRVAIGLALIVTALVTTLANQFLFDNATAHPASSGETVRVVALRSDDGDVHVALQQRVQGVWGDRQRPAANVLRTGVPVNTWLASSPVMLPGKIETAPLFCVIAHGAPDDYFWRVVRAYAHEAAHVTDTNLRFESHVSGAEQADFINRCSADGAAVIAATLANPEAVTESLLAAKASGARIVTFNSGAEHAAAAGSEIHIGLDDRQAGRVAGQEFNDSNITGTVGCIIHEARNTGLDERCAGLAETYQGAAVVELRLPGATAQGIVDSLTGPDGAAIDAILALNADTFLNALTAVEQLYNETDREVHVSSVGSNRAVRQEFSSEVRSRHVDVLISDSVDAQGFLVISAMQYVHNLHVPAVFITSPQIWKATPVAYSLGGLQADPQTTRAMLERFAELLANAGADGN